MDSKATLFDFELLLLLLAHLDTRIGQAAFCSLSFFPFTPISPS